MRPALGEEGSLACAVVLWRALRDQQALTPDQVEAWTNRYYDAMLLELTTTGQGHEISRPDSLPPINQSTR